MTYDQAMRAAKHNAAYTNTPRYVFAYINDWRVETEPCGTRCYQVLPDGSTQTIERKPGILHNTWKIVPETLGDILRNH